MNFWIMGFFEFVGVILRKNKVLFWVFISFLVYIAAGKAFVGDRLNYYLAYASHSGGFELGYEFLMCFFRNMGIPFKGFMAFVFIIIFIMMSYVVLSLTHNGMFVLCIYFLFPFWMNAEHIRFFMGMCIAMMGFVNFLATEKKFNYIIACLFASLFHTSCILFLIYLCVNQKYVWKLLVFLTILFWGSRYVLLEIFSKTSNGSDKIYTYIGTISFKSNVILYITFYFLIIFLTLFLNKKNNNNLVKKDIVTYQKSKYGDKTYFIKNFNVISIFFVELLYLNCNFERLLGFLLLFDYCFIANVIRRQKKIGVFRMEELFLIIFLLVYAGSRFYAYLNGDGWSAFIEPFMITGGWGR